jgi:hypothetical protein
VVRPGGPRRGRQRRPGPHPSSARPGVVEGCPDTGSGPAKAAARRLPRAPVGARGGGAAHPPRAGPGAARLRGGRRIRPRVPPPWRTPCHVRVLGGTSHPGTVPRPAATARRRTSRPRGRGAPARHRRRPRRRGLNRPGFPCGLVGFYGILLHEHADPRLDGASCRTARSPTTRCPTMRFGLDVCGADALPGCDAMPSRDFGPARVVHTSQTPSPSEARAACPTRPSGGGVLDAGLGPERPGDVPFHAWSKTPAGAVTAPRAINRPGVPGPGSRPAVSGRGAASCCVIARRGRARHGDRFWPGCRREPWPRRVALGRRHTRTPRRARRSWSWVTNSGRDASRRTTPLSRGISGDPACLASHAWHRA